MKIQRLAIVGVGLIGGSCALALRAVGAVDRVIGIGRSEANLRRAKDLNIIDDIATNLTQGVANADVIVVATPVGQFPSVFTAIAQNSRADALITDGGSTKRDVVSAARTHLATKLSRFVPAHPIAGAEKTGADAARTELYRGKNVVLTPLPETDADALSGIDEMWRLCGARVSHMTPEEHDGIFAAVSHLPHVLAYALVDMIAARPQQQRLFDYAAGGFRDFTRIASSSPEMWSDICVANRDRLIEEMDQYIAEIQGMRDILAKGDAHAIEALFARARTAREEWLQRREGLV